MTARGTAIGAEMSWRRPALTSYAQDMALFNTPAKWASVGLILLVASSLPMTLADDWLQLLATALVMAIGAIGLNLVTGYAGQVLLGHAFFVGVGAYTAAVVSGDPGGPVYGLGVTSLPAWLIAAGLVAAAAGAILAPLATRLRGLYPAIVTLGLVFIGEHFFKEWGSTDRRPERRARRAGADVLGHDLTIDGAPIPKSRSCTGSCLVMLGPVRRPGPQSRAVSHRTCVRRRCATATSPQV